MKLWLTCYFNFSALFEFFMFLPEQSISLKLCMGVEWNLKYFKLPTTKYARNIKIKLVKIHQELAESKPKMNSRVKLVWFSLFVFRFSSFAFRFSLFVFRFSFFHFSFFAFRFSLFILAFLRWVEFWYVGITNPILIIANSVNMLFWHSKFYSDIRTQSK